MTYSLTDNRPLDPCTPEAEREGCTCRLDGHPYDPDTEVRIDRWCPLHGQDPDAARDAQEDRRHDR